MTQKKKQEAEVGNVLPESISVSQVVLPDKWNRDKAGDLKGLIRSIKQAGQLVPIVVRKVGKDKYEVSDGRRRLLALKEIGEKTVRITSAQGAPEDDYINSLVINLQRAGHNPMEKARVYRELSETGMLHKDIGKKCGDVTESSISQHLAFFELPAKMQRALRDANITPGHARQLLRANEEEDMAFQEKLYDKMSAHGMSVSDSEEVVAHYVHRKEEKAQAKAAKSKKPTDGKPAKTKPARAGRKIAAVNYDEYDIKPPAESKIREYLRTYDDMRTKTRSPRKQAHYKDVLFGMELVAGIIEFED